MTVDQHIKHVISNYPTSYAISPDYAACRFYLLSKLFFSLGMGYRWAKQEGYLTDQKKVTPYGTPPKAKAKYNFERLMTEPLYRVYDTKDLDHSVEKFASELNLDEAKVIGGTPEHLVGYLLQGTMIVQSTHLGRDLPLAILEFSPEYSFFWAPGVQYIRADWHAAAVEISTHWLGYFQDPTLSLPAKSDLPYDFDRTRVITFLEQTLAHLAAITPQPCFI